jgi:hypothetical protein
MVNLRLILLLLALICFALTAAGVAAQRVNLLALGLCLWVLSILAT